MIELEKISGLPMAISDDYTLKFHKPLADIKPATRVFKDMVPVLMDPTAKSNLDIVYFMYRDIHFPDHEQMLRQANIRYDITVIPPGKIGQEYNKTIGHYHPVKEKTMFAYPELYEVLNGNVLFLIQKMDAQYKELVTVLAFEAKAGDKIIYPPNYGHIMVNVGDDVVVTANWVANGFESLYKPIADAHGMSYYVVADSDSERKYHFVPNPHYKNHPQVRMITKRNLTNFPIMHDSSPTYIAGTANPKNLEFLSYPEKYAVELSSITS
ncbi:MAG TPA: glucose-6-phosphate isomerase family protein [Verrucomicrobiae bacterium]|nr:glucose-6-phosphate isomerase family protein [Verrucomicrobiae bacterium]